ncbi:MAG: hypothetical protein NC094_04455 [Bacteroidales bacterium]|nr:hypothetical protein [Lachnoclostridium sp.]MCM1383941.1 hypothetical protein [Lachnoclostridium sp.]MCM1464650.1 hypothetical protein [Bacteroidales bacterium]
MRVFLVSYAGQATGGTELLHQFCRCLMDNGIESYMMYSNVQGVQCPTPEPFLKYGVKYVRQFVDADDTILILTEIQLQLVEMCKKGTVMVWWLSVGNYLGQYQEAIKNANHMDVFGLKLRKDIIHFVQSHYAKDFLEKEIGIKDSYFLMDYINDDIMQIATQYANTFEREDICLYNPKKGYEALKPLMEACRKDIQWIALEGYTPEEMAMLMCRAKVYIDLGGHPGKDRIPREAAICGCLVLTNRVGSAAYKEDVGIPECYKLENTEDVDAALHKLYELLDGYQEKAQEYSDYRASIANEKEEFMRDAKTAMTILKNCVAENSKPGILSELQMHEQMMLSLGNAANQLNRLASAAALYCKTGKRENVINNLLTMDYLVQVMNEAMSVELSELAEESSR